MKAEKQKNRKTENRRQHPCLIFCFSVFLLFCFGPSLSASPEEVSALLAGLSSDSYTARQDATERLLADDTLTPNTLSELFAESRSPEQRQRLLAIAHHHLLRQHRQEHFDAADPQGCIGVQLEAVAPNQLASLNRPAARVAATLPGFPAHGRLLPGDLILMIDGRAFRRDTGTSPVTELTAHVLAQGAGKTVTLIVRRANESVTVTLPIAGRKALEAMYIADVQGTSLAPDLLRRVVALRDQLLALTPPPRNLLLQPVS